MADAASHPPPPPGSGQPPAEGPPPARWSEHLGPKIIFVSLWLMWGSYVLQVLVTSIQAHRGHPENYLAALAFLPAVVFTFANLYLLKRKASPIPLAAITAWIAGLTSHGQTTLGPVIGLVCFFMDGLNPFTFIVIWVVRWFLRRNPKPAKDPSA